MSDPIRISSPSSTHFEQRQLGEYMSLPSALPALTVSMHAGSTSSLSVSFAGAPRASDLLAHQLQKLKEESQRKSRRSRRANLRNKDPRRFCSSSRSPSREREDDASLMRLKSVPSSAMTTLNYSIGKMCSQTVRDRSLSPPAPSLSPADSCAFSPPEVMTPHSLLFHHTKDGALVAATPTSSWSSSKCGFNANDELDIIHSSFDSLQRKFGFSTGLLYAPTIPSFSNFLMSSAAAQDSNKPTAYLSRRRSKSDVIQPTKSWLTSQDTNAQQPSQPPLTATEDKDAEPTKGIAEEVGSADISSNPAQGNTNPSQKGPSDFSAYVSGIGTPIDPDLEFSTVAQLQTFRFHSRSRSVGPTDIRGERRSDPTGCNTPFSLTSEQSSDLRKRTRISSPRPPLLNVRDTALIPSLSALGPAICNPGYQLKPHPRANESVIPADENTPPASPRLYAQPPEPEVQSPESEVVEPSLIPSLKHKSSLDENGFRTVISKGARRRRRRDEQPTSRPPAEDPVPISPDAIPEPVENLETQNNKDFDEEDFRGRSRGRARNGRPRPLQSTRALATNYTKASKSSLDVKDSNSRRTRNTRMDGLSYAAAASSKPGHRDEHLSKSGIRGRRGAVKIVNSSSSDSRLALPCNLPTDTSETSNEDESSSSRPRLLSNSAHLLTLSLELAMIRNGKISAPLKPRWGKRRDDDFRPIPGFQSQMKMMHTQSCCPRSNPSTHDPCTLSPTNSSGSPLKYTWMPQT
ncbi:hypothetical protein MPSI1_000946 [Malassezia psittaci]|uniref:Uncharacterized protein n=1 Tax=Malassezia psittaci TaxID=1821823 RepID=A0AAF0F921_9BASI|nr:hypothetical protein MPSI1_000946 [Malassezia psittaci]